MYNPRQFVDTFDAQTADIQAVSRYSTQASREVLPTPRGSDQMTALIRKEA